MNKRNILNLFFYLMTVVTISCLTSCSDSDGDGPKDIDTDKLEGTWDFQNGKMQIAGQTITIDKSDLGDLASEMGVSGFYDETLRFSGSRCNGQPYTLDGNKFEWDAWSSSDAEMMDVTIKTLNESKLVFHVVYNIPGVKATCDMTYAKR